LGLLAVSVACGGGSDNNAIELPDAAAASSGNTSGGSSTSSGAGTSSSSSGASSSSSGESSTSSSSSSSSSGDIDAGHITLQTTTHWLGAGGNFACSIAAGGGALKCWGSNENGPTVVAPGTNFIYIANGQVNQAAANTCAIRDDNTLFCFDSNTLSLQQQDTGTFKQVSSGTYAHCAIQTNGKLYCWGSDNSAGQLGSGDTSPHTTLNQVGTATNWFYSTTSGTHSCALDDTGALFCWGSGQFGQLGDGYNDAGAHNVVSPQAVEAGSLFIDVDAVGQTTCAVRTDGALLCTGAGYYIGTNSRTMKTIDTANDWARIRLSSNHACALKSSGKLYCWGYNDQGQIAQPLSTSNVSSPQQVGTDSDWVDIAVGEGFSCGRKQDTSVHCWGTNGAGQLGQANSGHLTPKLVGNAGEWSYVAAGGSGVCGIHTDSTLACWGNTASFGGGARVQTPQAVGSATTWQTVTTNGTSACGTQTGGALYCWGSSFSAPAPAAVGFTGVTSIALGSSHQCFVGSGGALYCWGDTIFGKTCGAPSGTTPQLVPGTAVWTKVAAGDEDTCGIQSDGSVYCCGFGYSSVEKQGTATNWTTLTVQPSGEDYLGLQGTALYGWSWIDSVTSKGTSGWTSFVTGSSHYCGTHADNSLWCYGSNYNGQLGDGTTTTRAQPTEVGSATDWTQVALGSNFTCGLRGHDLYCWGDNSAGQIGDGTAWSTTPVTVQ
jgi:alpha-tubulin suppressor-like RCC1 family protein